MTFSLHIRDPKQNVMSYVIDGNASVVLTVTLCDSTASPPVETKTWFSNFLTAYSAGSCQVNQSFPLCVFSLVVQWRHARVADGMSRLALNSVIRSRWRLDSCLTEWRHMSYSSSFTVHTRDTVSWGNPYTHTHTHIATLTNPIKTLVSGNLAWTSSDTCWSNYYQMDRPGYPSVSQH